MPQSYFALQDIEARSSLDGNESTDQADNNKNRLDLLDVATIFGISILRRIVMFGLFATYTLLVFFIGHTSTTSSISHTHYSPALSYLQAKALSDKLIKH